MWAAKLSLLYADIANICEQIHEQGGKAHAKPIHTTSHLDLITGSMTSTTPITSRAWLRSFNWVKKPRKLKLPELGAYIALNILGQKHYESALGYSIVSFP